MNQFITAGIMLDQLKKALYYGKNIEEVANLHQDYINEVLKLPPNSSITSSEDQWELNEEGRITLHAILGIATESVEMVEAIEKSISNNVEIDTVNLSEELGDLAWYIAALFYLELSGFNEPNLILRKNLLKLHKRFGDKFTFEKALNRDLVEERKILEA
jgi:NTP pyrophosphatase (non-canonical NTP hydrolase)